MGPSTVTDPISVGNREVSMANVATVEPNAPAVHNPEVTYDSISNGHRAARADEDMVGRLLWEDAAGLCLWDHIA